MSVQYRLVQWNRHKIVYDAVIAIAAIVYLVFFVVISLITHTGQHQISVAILLMRAFSTLGIVLLHIILCIGPLARMDARFAPLLYNRRHLGVTFFFVVLAHAVIAIVYYGGFGSRNSLLVMTGASQTFDSISGFPFELLGFVALLIFFVMAATSHDFWLKNLSPAMWKWIHMMVYPAYILVVGHVVLGILQSEREPMLFWMVAGGAMVVTLLHIVAAWRGWFRSKKPRLASDGWVLVNGASELADGSACVVVLPGGEAAAVFRNGNELSAMSNVCAHQGGPLGEGRIVDGCATCPWHGYQYKPACGQSPPPYTEKIPTYTLRVEGDGVYMNPEALPPGTATTPVRVLEQS